MSKTKKVCIMAGGTGGHVFPGLACAKQFQAQGYAVHWLGTAKGLEANIIPPEQIPLWTISIWGVRGKRLWVKLLAPFRILVAFCQSLIIMLKIRPQVVLGMGGFASGPGGLAAVCLGKPLVIHEQNAVAGLTNKILAKFAKKILTAFPEVFPRQPHADWVGNPLRSEVMPVGNLSHRLSQAQPLNVLVLGGSRGARFINDRVSKTFISHEHTFNLWHQTGEADFNTLDKMYKSSDVTPYRVEPFITNMQEAYAWADIVIARSGALTVSEIAASGLPAIFIPFPYAVDDHQYKNALMLEQAGAARIVRQRDFGSELLLDYLKEFDKDRNKLITMGASALKQAKPEATAAVINACKQVEKNA